MLHVCRIRGNTMRKPAYAVLERIHQQDQHELWLAQIALACVHNEMPEAIETVREDCGQSPEPSAPTYRYELYRMSAAHGGILIITFSAKGQTPSTTAHYLEEYRLRRLSLHEQIAVERLSRSINTHVDSVE